MYFNTVEEDPVTERQEKLVVVEVPVPTFIPKNPVTCCHPGTTYVDLESGSVCNINNAAVTVVSAPTVKGDFSNTCNRQAVLKVGIFLINY